MLAVSGIVFVFSRTMSKNSCILGAAMQLEMQPRSVLILIPTTGTQRATSCYPFLLDTHITVFPNLLAGGNLLSNCSKGILKATDPRILLEAKVSESQLQNYGRTAQRGMISGYSQVWLWALPPPSQRDLVKGDITYQQRVVPEAVLRPNIHAYLVLGASLTLSMLLLYPATLHIS